MPFNDKAAWAAMLVFTMCGGSAGLARPAPQAVPAVPPQAPPPDMPAGAGPSATSSSTTEAEQYDEVGYASWYGDELRGQRTASGGRFDPDWITAASRALPMGSYAEVTSLDNGKTILVEITDRGPQRRDRLIDLSLGAAKLLGIAGKSIAPVRVRAVDPPPADEVALRQGMPASARLDSPEILLQGLRARLADVAAPTPAVAQATLAPSRPGTNGRAMIVIRGKPSPTIAAGPNPLGAVPKTHLRPPVEAGDAAKPVPVPAKPAAVPSRPAPPPSSGHYVVQVAAFSTGDRAKSLADGIDGHVIADGRFWRVQLGPFDDAAAANRARDAAAKRGYGDARVVHED
jgi:rare lipoprotein A